MGDSDLHLLNHDLASVSSNGIRLIHHNVQGLLSQVSSTVALHICDFSPTYHCIETGPRFNDSIAQISGYDFYCLFSVDIQKNIKEKTC